MSRYVIRLPEYPPITPSRSPPTANTLTYTCHILSLQTGHLAPPSPLHPPLLPDHVQTNCSEASMKLGANGNGGSRQADAANVRLFNLRSGRQKRKREREKKRDTFHFALLASEASGSLCGNGNWLQSLSVDQRSVV